MSQFAVTPDGKFKVTDDGKFLIGEDCSCCGVIPGPPCPVCLTNTSWPSQLFMQISGITTTRDHLWNLDGAPGHPWDGSPYSISTLTGDQKTLNPTALFSQCDRIIGSIESEWFAAGNPFFEFPISVYLGLCDGSQPIGNGGYVIGSAIGATADDVIVYMRISQYKGTVGSYMYWEYAQTLYSGIAESGLPNCISLLPVTLTSTDLVVSPATTGLNDDRHYIDFQPATFVFSP